MLTSRPDPGRNPTLLSRRLAHELMRLREAGGLTREEVTTRLAWASSTIFRIETVRSRPQPGNVRALLDLYAVTGAEREGLLQLARDARKPGWWHSFRDVLRDPYEVYIGLEAGAASLRNFEPILLPGLLQTAGYARETFRSGPADLDDEAVEKLTKVRMARQSVLGRPDSPRLRAVVDEAAIRRVVGGPDMMLGQLAHLADAARQGAAVIQVIPFGAGAHVGYAGPFVVVSFAAGEQSPLVYIETLAGDIYLEKRADVDRYTLAFDKLLAVALDPEDSIRLIEQAAQSLT